MNKNYLMTILCYSWGDRRRLETVDFDLRREYVAASGMQASVYCLLKDSGCFPSMHKGDGVRMSVHTYSPYHCHC